MPRTLPALVLLAAWLVPAAHAARAPLRILYASDWNGPTQIFALDPTGRAPLAQITFDRPEPCHWTAACGFTDPLPSPDGRRLAFHSGGAFSGGRTLWLARANGTGAQPLGHADAAAWAPDSQRLAWSAADGIHVLGATGGDRVVDRRPGALGLAFSRDGRTLAFVSGNELILLRRGHECALARDALGPLAWAPDGHRIAYATRSGISFVETATGRTRLVYRARGLPDTFQLPQLDLAWSPDGGRLAFSLGGTHALDVRTLRTRTLTSDGGHDLAWSPDGRMLLYVQGGESVSGD